MPNVKFLVRSKSDKKLAPIFCRVYHGKQ